MRGMKLRLMWYQALSFMLDPVADIYDKQIDCDRILTFADPGFERQVIACNNASFYDGIDFNADGKGSRNEVAYVRSIELVCDGIASPEDLRYLCNLNNCTLCVENLENFRLRTLDGIYDVPGPWSLTIVDLPITDIDAAFSHPQHALPAAFAPQALRCRRRRSCPYSPHRRSRPAPCPLGIPARRSEYPDAAYSCWWIFPNRCCVP